MADNRTIIKLRRSKLNLNDGANKSKLNLIPLEFGEAQYFNYQTDAFNGNYLIVGDGNEILNPLNTDLYRFKAFPKTIVDNQVFNNTTDVLTKEDGTIINSKTIANNVTVEYDSKPNDMQTVTTALDGRLDTLEDWKANLKYAASDKAGGDATAAKKLTVNGGTDKLPVYFKDGVPTQCSDTLSVNISGNAGTASKLVDTVDVGSDTMPVYFKDGLPVKVAEKGSSKPITIDISGNAATATSATNATNATNSSKIAASSGNTLYVTGISQSKTGDSYKDLYYNTGIKITDKNVLLGAAWNDFAEFRKCSEKPGYVVVEKGDGSLVRSDKRLQPGASIISDTYGMVIGKNEEGYAPIAVAGRVLAYAIDKEHMKAGDPLCAGYNGTVSKMSRLETILYPDRIVGYVSEIPSYALWNEVLVDNRIWVKVK